MRIFPFLILAYVILGLQIGLNGYVDVYDARPNLVLLAAVYIAVNAQRDAALLGCFFLGLGQDLLSSASPIGLNAFSYSLVGMFIISTQDVVYKDHFLTHLTLGLAGGLLYAGLVYGHGWLYYTVMHPLLHKARPAGTPLVASAVYTAAIAPLVLGLLRRMKRMFGFRPIRMHSAAR